MTSPQPNNCKLSQIYIIISYVGTYITCFQPKLNYINTNNSINVTDNGIYVTSSNTLSAALNIPIMYV